MVDGSLRQELLAPSKSPPVGETLTALVPDFLKSP